MKRKTKRNENEIRIEVESKSKIPKIEHRNVIECQKNNIDFNNKEKSKTLIESNKNDIEIENAIKSKEQKNLNAEKIKEKKDENLLDKVNREIIEFLVKVGGRSDEEKKKTISNKKLKTDDYIFIIDSMNSSNYSIKYGTNISYTKGKYKNLLPIKTNDIGSAIYNINGEIY